jgi:subfamily B ATP-binding cassette protein MsbA
MLDRILGKEIALYIKRHRSLILISLFLTALSSLFLIIPAYLIKPFVDEGMRSGSEPVVWKIPWITFDHGSWLAWRRTEKVILSNISPNALLIVLTAIAFASMLLRSVTRYLSTLSAAAFSNRAVRSLRVDLFEKFLSLPLGFYHSRNSGELIGRATSDLTVMQTLIAEVFIGLIECPLMAAVFICYLFIMDYKMTLLVFFLGPSILGLIWIFGHRVRRLSTRVQDAIAEVTAAYHETLLCLKVVQSFRREEKETVKFRKLVDILYKRVMRWNRWHLGLGPLLVVVVFIFLPAILIIGKIYFHHTFGEFVSMVYAFSRVYHPIKRAATVNNGLKTIQGATTRIFSIMEIVPHIQDSPNAVELPRHRESVIFKDVSFGYTPQKPILKGISFQVKKGEMVAFVGSTGAGKSTLLDLIPRFYDVSEGKITIDGIDIRDVTIESLRSQIGIVSQEVLLFHDTIANNIRYGAPEKSNEDITAAAKAANAHDFILAQLKGYQTLVGDRGTLLSGGQKQRVAIARALLIDPAILILDEAAAALDGETEKYIRETLEKLKGKLTIFVVAHRLSTIMRADHIFVLEDGEIIESGTATTLMTLNSRFRQLHDLQFQA